MGRITEIELKNEKWVGVPNYSDIYQISNLGRVKSLRRNKILKSNLKKSSGYCQVSLCRNGVQKDFLVHRLVMESFTGFKSTRSRVIDHIDNNKSNNKLSNLQILSQRENTVKSSHLKLTGVYIRPSGSYFSTIRNKGKATYLGTFKTKEEASQAYNNALNTIIYEQ